jgi:hypothetical protein
MKAIRKKLSLFRQHLTARVERSWRFFSHPAYRGQTLPVKQDAEHLDAAMAWLRHAQDVTRCGGVSAYYNMAQQQWEVPYRETTGYIIPSFLNYYQYTGDRDCLDRAIAMGDWELRVQLPDGAVFEPIRSARTGVPTRDGAIGIKVFNTGMVLFGLMALFRNTKQNKYLQGALLAGNWLCCAQRVDGAWEKFTEGTPCTIHSRVAWALAELTILTGDQKYSKTAVANLNWVLSQQRPSGWFANCSLQPPNHPWTHTIAYTIRGLLESSRIVPDGDKYLNAALKAAASLRGVLDKTNGPFLPCSFDEQWKSTDTHSCLTGNVQMAGIFLRLEELGFGGEWRSPALRLIDGVKSTQSLRRGNPKSFGGIPGSEPIDVGYCEDLLLNWATKFFIDALMLKTGCVDPADRYPG